MNRFINRIFIILLIMIPVESRLNGYSIEDKNDPGVIDHKSNSGKGFHTGSQSCVVCHVPVDMNNNVATELDWMSEQHSGTFEVYTFSPTVSGEPNSSSKLCLSCHDGTFAIEDERIYKSSTQSITYMAYTGSSNHPVSIPYTSMQAIKNSRLADPSITPSGLGGTIEEDLLVNGQIECITCHDVHQNNGDSASADHSNEDMTLLSPSLKISNFRSGLCLTCHLL